MVNAIIVDDEEKNRESLAKLINQFCFDVNIIDKVESIAIAKESINKNNPQLIFLDIEMPGGDGFKLLQDIDQPQFEVIFTTAHANYAIKAIKFAALDYLLKPINVNELKVAVEKAVDKIDKSDRSEINSKKFGILQSNVNKNQFDFNKIALPTLDGIDFYDVDDIIRCEAERAYCNFYTIKGEKILVSKSLKEFEEILTECNFYRIHKSHMVNLKHIKKYYKGKGGQVLMSDESFVDVSVRRKEDLMKVLANYKTKKLVRKV